MTLQRDESIASSAGHEFADLHLKGGVLNSEVEQDDLLQTPSLEAGIFGVLFTLSQEKNQQHIRYHWIFLKIFLDAWQIFSQILSPEMGWVINEDSTIWKVVSVLNFGWLSDLGYKYYVAILYSMAGVLAFNVVLCVWVAWSFKEQKFDYVWPIKVVRGFSYVFLQVFDVTSLNFLQLGISCNYMGPHEPHLHMALFPAYSCSRAPHIVNALVSGLLLLMFVAVAMLVNMSEVEVSPTSKSPQALGHSGAEVTAFGIKTLMTLVGVFFGQPKVAAVIYLVLSVWLAWEYLRWVPHLLTWVNCLKSGVAVMVAGVAGLQVAVVLLPASAAHALTMVMAFSMGPLFVIGAVMAWARTKMFTNAVLKAFRNNDPEAIKPKDIYHFSHPRDVEVAARSARVWTDLYTLEKTAVHRAEEVIKAGVALFPENAFVSLVYANFMLDMLGFSQTGARQLESARKLNPSLMCRFMLFVRQQQATQKAASSNVGKGGNMDLLGYVEYQRKQRMVLRHHKDALQAMANFWRILGSSSVSFTSLSKSLEDIDTSVSQAETAYRVVLELYNNSPRLVRLYAKFLETIKQDPWGAAEYNAAAERLEQSKDENGQGPALPDGTPISRMDDVEKGVVVVNAFGDIQVANKKLHAMFGYKKGDLDGKNVTVLMPPHEAKRHPARLRRYIDSGEEAAPYFRHPVLGIHRERVAFPVRISVSRASGLGEDSVFIGILEALPAVPGIGRVWVARDGLIVCCDPGFVTCFGYHPEDVIGTQLDKLLRSGSSQDDRTASQDVWAASKANHDNHELVQSLLEKAMAQTGSRGSLEEMDEADLPTVNCRVLHKYDFAKECKLSIRTDLTESSIYEVQVKLLSDEPQLLMVVERKGAIRHMSGDLAKVLGARLLDTTAGNRQTGRNGNSSGNGGGNGGGGGGGGGGNLPDRMMQDEQLMLELMADSPPCALDDFLPAPWKHMHHKYRKYVAGGSPNLSGLWGCRAALSDNSGSNGPTMRLVGVHGKPVYVHVAVASREESGDVLHVVRMARSSLETAVDERRLRVRLSENGTVQAVTQGSAVPGKEVAGDSLFGFPSEQLVGCRIWDFLAVAVNQQPANRQPQQPRDVLAEAEAMMAGARMSMNGAANKKPPEPKWGEFNMSMFDSMVTSTMQTPGMSWRVNVVPPTAAAEAAAIGNPARVAAMLSRRTRQAVLRFDVTLPPPGSTVTNPGQLNIYAELWASEAVTGVVEIDGAGRVSALVEEELRPPGLVFGVPQDDLTGTHFAALIKLLPGQSPVGLLTDSGIAKKSNLKVNGKKGKGSSTVKVGPVHYLEGFHRDGQPLSLAVQVVGKPGPGNPTVAIIRIATKNPKSNQRPKMTAYAAAVAAHKAHVHLDLGAKQAAAAAAAAAGTLPSALKGSSSNANAAATAAAASLALSRSNPQLGTFQLRLPQPTLQGRDANVAAAADAAAAAVAAETGDTARRDSLDLDEKRKDEPARAPAELPSAEDILPGVPPVPLQSMSVPRIAGLGQGPPGKVAAMMPGAGSLAAGVAGLIKAKSSALEAGDATQLVLPEDKGTRMSSPLKPESPPIVNPGKRATSPRVTTPSPEDEDKSSSRADTDKALSTPEKGEGRGTGDGDFVTPRDLRLETASTAAGDADDQDIEASFTDIGTVDKWVATGGKFYQNRTQSVASGGDLDDPDDDDDGDGDGENEGSVGATSRATSSRWASPHASEAGDNNDHHDHHNRHKEEHQRPAESPPADVAKLTSGMTTGWDVLRQGMVQPLVPGGLPGDKSPGAPDFDALDLEAAAMFDHADSDGGESGITGMSGGSDASDTNTPADFKRGKRYRKLVKLMDSPQAQKALVRLKINTTLGVLAASAVHVLCFALIITAMQRQSKALDQLALAGGAQRYLQRALVSVRALDQVYKGKGSNTTYILDNAPAIANDVLTYSDLYKGVNNGLMETAGTRIEDMYNMQKVEVWDDYNTTTGEPFISTVTLWELVERISISAKTVYQNFETWHNQGINISSNQHSQFLLNSGQALVPAMKGVLDGLLQLAVDLTNTVNRLQLTFLLLEGCFVTSCCALGLVYMLRSASDQRYQLYETFLTIPVGLTRALASQTTHLLDDDESEDQDDDEGSQKGDHVDDAASMHHAPIKRKALFDESAANTDGHGQPHGNNNGQAQPHDNNNTAHNHHSGNNGNNANAHGGNNNAANAHGHQPKQRRASVVLSEYSPIGHARSGARRQSMDTMSLGGYHNHAYSLRSGYGGTSRMMYRSASTLGHHHVAEPGCFGRLWAKIWRSSAVRPYPANINGSALFDMGGPPRRTLERNSKVANGMLLSVVTYSMLIILFYSIDYAILLRVKDQVALQAVADHNSDRTYRAVFFAQELVSEENATIIPSRAELLRNASIALRDAYYTLRMGASAWTAVGPDVEKFPLVGGRGLVKESHNTFQLFFSDGQCMRLAEHLPCPPTTYRYFRVINAGADGMMIQLLSELASLVSESVAAATAGTELPGLDNDHFDYIYNVGTVDLNDVNMRISAEHMDNIKGVFKVVIIMHGVLFLLLMGVFLCFMLLVYLPLLRRMNKEKRRIAEMMSQLPPELDVMRLVSTALMGPKAGGHHHHHHITRVETTVLSPAPPSAQAAPGAPPEPAQAFSPAVTGAPHAEEHDGGKAYQAWKDILNRASSVSGATKDVSNTGGSHTNQHSGNRRSMEMKA